MERVFRGWDVFSCLPCASHRRNHFGVHVNERFAHFITLPGGTKIYRGPKFKENKEAALFDHSVYQDKIAFYAETPDDAARAAAKKETV